MVRAENGSEFGSLSAAQTAQCGVCGQNLHFKDNKGEDQATQGISTARHCGKIYFISSTGTFTIGTAPDPKYQEKEKKIGEKMKQASDARAEGKASEGSKLEQEAREDEKKLNAEEDEQDEKEATTREDPKTSGFGGGTRGGKK